MRAKAATAARKSVVQTLGGAKIRPKSSESTAWDILNRRRLRLIDQELEKGLTAAEAAELRILQAKADDHLRTRSTITSRLGVRNRGPLRGRRIGREGFDNDNDSRGNKPLAMNLGPLRGQTQCRPDVQTGMLFPARPLGTGRE